VPDFWLALFAFLGVILIGVMAGIVIGVVLSLLLLLLRLGTPHTAVLGRDSDRGFVDVSVNPGALPVPGVLVLRVDGPLVFASVDGALDDLRTALDGAPERPSLVVLDLSACYEIDVTSADALASLVDDLRLEGTEVRFAGAHAPVRGYAARLNLPNLAGLAEPHPTVEAALVDVEGR
jgi:MFS superfamily sulfate permease-like transporter